MTDKIATMAMTVAVIILIAAIGDRNVKIEQLQNYIADQSVRAGCVQ